MGSSVVLCDIDGTLSDFDHRRIYLSGDKRNWGMYLAMASLDEVRPFTKSVVGFLFESGYEIHILTARHRDSRGDTEHWLKRGGISYHGLHMPRYGESNFLKDDVLKSQWLDEQGKDFESRIVCCLEDREDIVKMRRDRGLICWQVA